MAIDGEGFSDGDEFTIVLDKSGSRYYGREHRYAYLAASDGGSVYSPNDRLSLGECLEFLFSITAKNKRAIIVAFGGSYDITCMVCHDLNPDQIRRLLGKGEAAGKLHLEIGGYLYQLEYRPRKCFTAKRWRAGEPRYTRDADGKRKLTPHDTVRLWDVWGFFQDSFVGVLSKWLPGDPDFEFIKRMKGNRSHFERSEIEEIKIYNAAELRCLVKVMDKVRDAINDLGLKITRWDGAGAIAAAMLSKHNVKEHLGATPPDVFEAARRAYSGGHIEVCKLGYHKGKVHHYDVNSAYPSAFFRLPSLSNGRWIKNSGAPDKGFSIVHIRAIWNDGAAFYPLFFRDSHGNITYPRSIDGWYWFPEYQAAESFRTRHGCEFFEVIESWSFVSDADARPFQWVGEYYARRRFYIADAATRGVISGPEKIIKLGLNSLYGKTAQQVGWRKDKGEIVTPPYFNLCWAGYVTSYTRAMLMEAAIEKPASIIGFATDGLFSTEPLDLYTPKAKELGAWEYQIHDGITMVMPGVYWLHDGEKVANYSRGFDKTEMRDAAFVHEAWKRRQVNVPISITRLIGLGTACASRHFWRMRGCFVSSRRTLALNGDNSKRYPISLGRNRPHLRLIPTTPREPPAGELWGQQGESAPYPIAWIDGDPFDPLADPQSEMNDELEAMDAALA